MLVARNDTGTANTLSTRTLSLLVLDLTGPDGRPWTDLLGKPLDLIWIISRNEKIVCRGNVTPEGWIIARLNSDTGAGGMTLRVGLPPGGGRPSQGISGPDAEFEWCEKHEFEDSPEPSHPVEKAVLSLNRIGYHAGRIEHPLNLVGRAALIHFQREHDMKTTGKLDFGEALRIGQEMGRFCKDAQAAKGM